MAVPNPSFADLFTSADAWVDLNPDYAALMGTLGHGSATTGPDVATGMHNLATRTPTAIAFVMEADEDHVYIGHSPHLYPTDVLQPTAMDGRIVLLLGRHPDSYVPVTLPDDAFTRLANTHCLDIATIVGATGHGAAPPVVRTGGHAATDANVNTLRARRAHLLPPTIAAHAVGFHADGRYTLQSFYTQFVQGKHDSADAATAALWAETAIWFRMASTNTAAGNSVVRTLTIEPAIPPHRNLLSAVCNRRIKVAMAQIGVGGPALSNNTFQAGIDGLKATLTENATSMMEYDRASKRKTFAEKHGAALETRLLRFTEQNREEDLPEVHKLLVQAARGREYSILEAQFAEAANNSSLPITSSNAPLATPSLLDQVFRSYSPSNDGLILGRGLTPFAIICEGHSEVESIKRLVKSASLVEAGSTLTLSDAASLTMNDVRLPTEVFIAVEKLYGWSTCSTGTTLAS